LGAAGLVLGGGLSGLRASDEKGPALPGPDRSQKAPTSPVAITRCGSYEPKALRRKLDETLNLIGGLKKLVEGKTVTVKLNITGGPKAGPLGGLAPYLTYHVHPNIVAALCAAVHDAGAKRIVVVESSYELRTTEEILTDGGWDVGAIKAAGGHKVDFIDTRHRGPFPKYSELKVSFGGFIYPAFHVSQAYEKTDVFVSLAKMKDHGNAGVTMGAKNLFGIAPLSLYGGDAPNENSVNYRGPILHFGQKKVPAGVPGELDHGIKVGDFLRRVPRVTADTVGARPIDLVVIDGIVTNRGGEGPWLAGTEPMMPKLILAGRNVVSADAVCTAVMGYDPLADHFQFPFMGENHLKLLAAVGVGTNDPERIEVRGLPIREALHPFNPQRLKLGEPLAWERWNRCRLAAATTV
jgi:uncharacterized protein (DUF362 family)